MPWHLSVARSRHLPLPAGFIEPCRPTLVASPPAGPGWLHEMKHDGFRILARKQGERVQVWSRRGALLNNRFPSIAEAVGALPVANALIDGEAVTFRPDGHSDFAALRTKEGGERASFVAFDLLDLEGDDLRDRPLEERREALARLVHGVAGIQFSASVAGEGATVFAHACQLGLEGIVSKRGGSRYKSGASRNWLKCLSPEFERPRPHAVGLPRPYPVDRMRALRPARPLGRTGRFYPRSKKNFHAGSEPYQDSCMADSP
jgi:bifunctional non-homologous end joining protein LigD